MIREAMGWVSALFRPKPKPIFLSVPDVDVDSAADLIHAGVLGLSEIEPADRAKVERAVIRLLHEDR